MPPIKTAAFSFIAMAACQPNEGPVERASHSLDNAAQQAGDQLEQAGAQAQAAGNDAKS